MAQREPRPIPETIRQPPERAARLLPFERSALLHPRAADALILAATPYPGRPPRRRAARATLPGRPLRVLRWLARHAT